MFDRGRLPDERSRTAATGHAAAYRRDGASTGPRGTVASTACDAPSGRGGGPLTAGPSRPAEARRLLCRGCCPTGSVTLNLSPGRPRTTTPASITVDTSFIPRNPAPVDRFPEHTAWRKRTGDTRVFRQDLPPEQRSGTDLRGQIDLLAASWAWHRDAKATGDARGVRLSASCIRDGERALRRMAGDAAARDRRVPAPPVVATTTGHVIPTSRNREGRSTRRRSTRGSPSSDDPSEADPADGRDLDELTGSAALSRRPKRTPPVTPRVANRMNLLPAAAESGGPLALARRKALAEARR